MFGFTTKCRNFTSIFKFRTAVIYSTHIIVVSRCICRAPARDAGKANSYQLVQRRIQSMSGLIYVRLDIYLSRQPGSRPEQTPAMDSRRGQDSTVHEGRSAGGRLPAQATAGRRVAGHAALAPMPSVGARCHEGRLVDAGSSWRIVYRIDVDAVLILEVFRKTTRQTPQKVIDTCKARIRNYDSA